MPNKDKLFVFFFSLLSCISYNEINRYVIKKHNPSNKQINSRSIIYGGTIWSIDNFWYLTQPKNFLGGKGFLLDTENTYTSVRRTPGYSFFYMAHLVLFGEKLAHKIIPYTQSIIFGLSTLALALSVFNFTQNKKIAFLGGIIYGCNPFTSGFVYYTITEAIHPAFVIFGFYFLSKCLQANFSKNVLISGIFFAIACLIRPLNGLTIGAGIAVLVSVNTLSYVERVKKIALFCFGFSLPVLPWAIRNYIVTKGDIVILEKYYHEDPMYMGKKQTYLSKWWMCWGNPRQEMFIDSLKNEIRTGQNDYISRFLLAQPGYMIRGYTKDELTRVLYKFKDCIRSEMSNGTYGIYHKPSDTLPPCEEDMKNEFQSLIRQYKKNAPFRYYVISPLLVRGKEFIFTSFASMYGSLKPRHLDFSSVQRIIKALLYVFNIALYVGFLGFLFFSKGDRTLKIFIGCFTIATFLFVVYNVHIEARYLLAVYPFLAISNAVILSKINGKWNELYKTLKRHS